MPGKGQTSIPEDLRRSIIALYTGGGMGYRAIAKKLECPPCTARHVLGVEGLMRRDPALEDVIPALAAAGLKGEDAAKEASRILGREITTQRMKSVMSLVRGLAVPEPLPQQHLAVTEERMKIKSWWGKGRYAIASDFHVRFHDPQVLEQLLAVKGDFDGCIVPGDLIDAMWLSRFRKEGYVSLQSEIDAARDVMARLVKRFGRVLYCLGNHEERLWKHLLEASEGIQRMAGAEGSKGVISALKGVQDIYFGRYPGVTTHHNWFVNIGPKDCDVLVCHADAYSKLQGKTAANVLEHMQNRTREYGLTNINTVMEAHTHRHSGPHRHRNVYLWELPAMVGPLDYQTTARANSGQTDTGYSIVEVGAAGLVFNKSRSFYREDRSLDR